MNPVVAEVVAVEAEDELKRLPASRDQQLNVTQDTGGGAGVQNHGRHDDSRTCAPVQITTIASKDEQSATNLQGMYYDSENDDEFLDVASLVPVDYIEENVPGAEIGGEPEMKSTLDSINKTEKNKDTLEAERVVENLKASAQ